MSPGSDNSLIKVKFCIRGTLVMLPQNKLRQRISGIRLRFQGKAEVEWTEGSGDNEEEYSEKEQYFKDDILLDGRGKDICNTPTFICLYSPA